MHPSSIQAISSSSHQGSDQQHIILSKMVKEQNMAHANTLPLMKQLYRTEIFKNTTIANAVVTINSVEKLLNQTNRTWYS